jgi:hypothetical protein
MELRSGNLSVNQTDHTTILRSGTVYRQPETPTSEPFLSFDDWKAGVNELVMEHLQMECDDLSDFPYQDCYAEYMEPLQVLNLLRGRLFRAHEEDSDVEMTYDESEQESYNTAYDESDQESYNTAYEEFHEWYYEIDRLVFNEFGQHLTDFPDLPYYDYYIAEVDPLTVFNHFKGEFFI